MSMCYLCDLCAKYQRVPGFDICYGAAKKFGEKQKKAIDYGRDDPKTICKHFEPKECGE